MKFPKMETPPMIHFPLKKTNELDWTNSIRKFITTQYQDDPNKYQNEIGMFNRYRQDIRSLSFDKTSIEILYRYYTQLDFLELHFQIIPDVIKTEFTW